MTVNDTDVFERIAALPIWRSVVEVEPLAGGLTNRNYLVRDGDERFVVRLGDDIPVHGILRVNEAAAAVAAFQVGVSPQVIHTAPGLMVSRFIAGRTLTPEDIRAPTTLPRIVDLIRRYHAEIARYYTGPVLAFWVFQVIRGYLARLHRDGSRLRPKLDALAAQALTLEAVVGPITLVHSHNDLLAANVIDDGDRLWIIDWDYAGLNSPLFDLANLSSNNDLAPAQDEAMLTRYFGATPGSTQRQSFAAMKCASLLREALWGAVSERHSMIAFDYTAYTDDYLARFDRALARLGAPPA